MNTGIARREGGFTLIEMVIVLVLIGLLAAVALPRMFNATEGAREKSLEGTAGAFGTAVAIAHAQWVANGNVRPAQTDPANKTFANLGGRIVFMNESGWPANDDPVLDSSYNNQTAEECLQVWNAVLQSAPAASANRNERADIKYQVSVVDANPDVCRYELVTNSDPNADPIYYFEYQLTIGDVVIFKPQLQ